MKEKQITTMKDAQKLLKTFAKRNNWKDAPNIDKFDHLEAVINLNYKPQQKTKTTHI